MEIWFWQLIVSPHIAGLARSLAELGHKVTYVAEKEMSELRAKQGWTVPDLGNVKLIMPSSRREIADLAVSAPANAIHISQGIRANGVIGDAQRMLKKLKRNQYIVMETVDDSGWFGWLKRAVYSWHFKMWRSNLCGVLAIGNRTRDWVLERGMPPQQIFSFAYFLPRKEPILQSSKKFDSSFRFVFVGQFIRRKRLDLLVNALSSLKGSDFKLIVVGSGPLERELRVLANSVLPGRIEWVGKLPISQVQKEMELADCLVLPSQHDGWGAVVSEALMSGTPAICSDNCGSSVVIEASGVGGVFEAGNIEALRDLLKNCISNGKIDTLKSMNLATWAACLSEEAGAHYLTELLLAKENEVAAPLAPWTKR